MALKAQWLIFLVALAIKQGASCCSFPAGCALIDVVIYRSLPELTSHWAIRSPSPPAAPPNGSKVTFRNDELEQIHTRIPCTCRRPRRRVQPHQQRELFLARRNLLGSRGRITYEWEDHVEPTFVYWSFCATVVYVHEFERVLNTYI